MRSVDLNCDCGEGFGAYRIGGDNAMLDIVTSVNVACGFHAGNPEIMARGLALRALGSAAIRHQNASAVPWSVLEKASMGVRFIAACRPVHHPQHLEAAGRDEPPYQKGRDEKKPDVEPCRVVPRN
jgi:LamB/YcsF family